MDQIAAAAGVSKLTVYSHFGDKDSLFTEAVRAHCEQGMPTTLFVAEPGTPVRERLLAIGSAFQHDHDPGSDRRASHPVFAAGRQQRDAGGILGGRPSACSSPSPTCWNAAWPAAKLEIEDCQRAASQFFTLLKGEPHALAVFGFSCGGNLDTPERHVTAVVDFSLRAMPGAEATRRRSR